MPWAEHTVFRVLTRVPDGATVWLNLPSHPLMAFNHVSYPSLFPLDPSIFLLLSVSPSFSPWGVLCQAMLGCQSFMPSQANPSGAWLTRLSPLSACIQWGTTGCSSVQMRSFKVGGMGWGREQRATLPARSPRKRWLRGPVQALLLILMCVCVCMCLCVCDCV